MNTKFPIFNMLTVSTHSIEEVAQSVSDGSWARIQFHGPEAFNPELLSQVNEICRGVSDRLQVRFSGEFDASVLQNLPDVTNLMLTCRSITNELTVAHLKSLARLHWEVSLFDKGDFLNKLDLDRFSEIRIGDSFKRNLDLSALSRARSLETLFVEGQAAGLAGIVGLPRLRKIVLRSYGKGNGLQFLRDVPNLEALTLILGGREHIEDLESSTLRDLQVIRVRGVQGLGVLSRFPRLRNLRIDDQIRLKVLDLRGAVLEKLAIINCKSLHDIVGLDEQDRLAEVVCGYVALDMDKLRDFHWPPSASTVRLASTSNRWNEAAALSLAARGHGGELSHWWL